MMSRLLGSRLTTLIVASLLPLMLLAIGPADAQTNKNSWAKWEETVRKAEKEGKVTIYMSRGGKFQNIVRAFHKEYPKIRVGVVLGGSNYTTRILSERRAQKYLADLVVTGPGTSYYVLYRRKRTLFRRSRDVRRVWIIS